MSDDRSLFRKDVPDITQADIARLCESREPGVASFGRLLAAGGGRLLQDFIESEVRLGSTPPEMANAICCVAAGGVAAVITCFSTDPEKAAAHEVRRFEAHLDHTLRNIHAPNVGAAS